MNFLDLIPISAVILTNILGCNIIYTYYINRYEMIKKYNYLLFYITFFTSLSWFVYGIITNDIYVWLSTFSPLFGSYMFIQLLHKQIDTKNLWMIELFCFILYFYFMFLTFGLTFISDIQIINKIKQIHFIMSMALSIGTNVSPMLILYEVIRTSNSELIYLPQALIGLLNLLMWIIYAFIINDIYQIISDIINFIMCLIQLVVYFYYNYMITKQNKILANNDKLNDKADDDKLNDKADNDKLNDKLNNKLNYKLIV